MEKKVFKMDFRGRELIVEHGEVAKQAHGAVLVRLWRYCYLIDCCRIKYS